MGLQLLHSIKPVGTFWTLELPFLASSVLLMLGNWSQHVFVDPKIATMDMKNSRVNYLLTYNCINHPFNQRTFNDGYQIANHYL